MWTLPLGSFPGPGWCWAWQGGLRACLRLWLGGLRRGTGWVAALLRQEPKDSSQSRLHPRIRSPRSSHLNLSRTSLCPWGTCNCCPFPPSILCWPPFCSLTWTNPPPVSGTHNGQSLQPPPPQDQLPINSQVSGQEGMVWEGLTTPSKSHNYVHYPQNTSRSLSLFPRGRGLVCLIHNWVRSFSQQSQWYYEVSPHTCQSDPSRKSTNNKCCRECGEKETFLHCLWKHKLMQPLWKIVWRFLKKLKVELPYDAAILFLGTYLDKTTIQKVVCTPVFIAAFTITKTWKQPKCSLTDEWIKKMWYLSTME